MRVARAAAPVFVAGWLASCSSPSSEPTASLASAVEGGGLDTTHTFAVGVIQRANHIGLCSGALLAPNLVATARHCVTQQMASNAVDCNSIFTPQVPAGDLLVTTDAQIAPSSTFVGVVQIVAPSGPDHERLCGNDIALLILNRNIGLSQYVTPAVNPPMTDHKTYNTVVTAIGYGISTPTDTTGTSAGSRRIKQNVTLACIPNDTGFTDCFGDPMLRQVMTSNEFLSGDGSTCEGDSGSSAYDQGSLNQGKLVSFGVLSRGGVSPDSKTCILPIYSRFDAWGQLLSDAANLAASMGGYSLPAWATPRSSTGPLDAAAASMPAVDGAAAAAGAPGSIDDGAVCAADGDCKSQNCVSTNKIDFVCASPCTNATCSQGFTCTYGFCLQAGAASRAANRASGGCSAASTGSHGGVPRNSRAAIVLALAGIAVRRRRRRADRLVDAPWKT
jgi:MYXO-CTERM domain-containing protein